MRAGRKRPRSTDEQSIQSYFNRVAFNDFLIELNGNLLVDYDTVEAALFDTVHTLCNAHEI